MKKGQKGYTLIEMLIAISISTLVAGAALMAVFQILTNTERSKNHMTASSQVQSAGFWTGRDAQLAQVITDNLTLPEFLDLSWTEGFSGDSYRVIYTLEDMPAGETKRLFRNLSVTSANGTANTTTLIAWYINPDTGKTSSNFSGGTLNLMFTATVGDGSSQENETRVYQFSPRPQ